jgi:citrate lyase subunit beta / citryl-CoA lyase
VPARAKVAAALNKSDWGNVTRAVRVNALDTIWCHDDVIEVVSAAGRNLDVLVIPKACSGRDVWWFDTLLSQLEAKLGLPHRIGLEVLIEEAEGLEEFRDLIGRFATGITIVTTFHDDTPYGNTASVACRKLIDGGLW